jgi:SAM-dependent methyltransferase
LNTSDVKGSTAPAAPAGAQAARCPVCRAGQVAEVRRHEPYGFYRCPVCDLHFVDPFRADQGTFDDYKWNREYADSFDAYVQLYRHSMKAKIAVAEDILGRRVASFLDVGCGNGLALEAVQALGIRNVGFDIDAAHVEFARARGLNAVQTYMEHFQTDERFDFIQIKGTLHLVQDVVGMMQRVHDLLTDDGVVFVDVPDQASLSSRLRVLRRRDMFGQLQPPRRNRAFTRRALAYLLDRSRLAPRRWVRFACGDPVYYPMLPSHSRKLIWVRMAARLGIQSFLGAYAQRGPAPAARGA